MVPRRDISTLAQLPTVACHHDGSKTALITGEGRLSYAELEAGAQRVANTLLRMRACDGARVAVLARDSIRSVLALFGAAKARAVYIGINWRWTGEEIAHVLDDARPALVFVDPEFLPTLHIALALSNARPKLVSLSEGTPLVPSWVEWLHGANCELPSLSYHWDDVVVQLYTSGTTGHPKGVLLANRSFFAIAREMAARGDPWMGWSDEDINLLFVPCFHIGGLWWLVRALALGSTNIVLRGFDPARILELIPRYRVSKTCMVPAMMQVLLAEPGCESTDFSSLRTILYGGAPIAPALLDRARRVFGCDFCQIYGMTETGNMAVCLRPEDHSAPQRLLAAGRALPGVEVRIVAADGRGLAPGMIGEIAIKSPAQMIGYYNSPEATQATLIDGWVHTGDSGYCDAEGFIYVCDRIKDMIICAGENVYPAEIERVLRSHAAVVDAAVIGVPDELWGEAALAFVVPRPGTDLTSREVLRHARSRLADFKIPRAVELVSELPRNASGKVLKTTLRESFWRGRERQVN